MVSTLDIPNKLRKYNSAESYQKWRQPADICRSDGSSFIDEEKFAAYMADPTFAPADVPVSRQSIPLPFAYRAFTPALPIKIRSLSSEKQLEQRNKRRTMASGSYMPTSIAKDYTEAERAVLAVLFMKMMNFKKLAYSDVTDEIAKIAGCCRRTMQKAVRKAQWLGHIVIQERPRRGLKNLPNIYRVLNKELIAWIRKGINMGRKEISMTSTGCSAVHTSNTYSLKEEISNELRDHICTERECDEPPE